MTLSDLLENPFIDLPKERPRHLTFQKYVKQTFAEYIDLVSDLSEEHVTPLHRYNPQETIIPNVNMICNHLLLVIEHYFNGDTFQASTVFHKLFTSAPNFNKNLYYIISFCSYDTPGIEKYYRIRLKEKKKFERKDLFHVPFEERNKIATKRYSIPGLPSLYLSDSIYNAWVELGKYDLRKYFFSRFETPILFLIPSTKRLKERYSESKQLPKGLDDFFTLWPLFLLCSIIVLETDRPFKPEYIIPQILLQWIKSEASWFDGIKYASTKDLNTNGYNIVIPIEKSKSNGYCDRLCRSFKLTEPISIKDLPEVKNLRISDTRETFLKIEEYLDQLETKSV